ncbi:MAG: metallophosphoesterase, partial [Saprospiraceae bacterium]
MNIKLLCRVLPFVLSFLTFHSIQGQNIIRGPYLQSVYQDHITVRWRTDESTSSKVWYGTSPSSLNNVITSSSQATDHEVLLEDLIPDTKYYYAVGNNSGQLANGQEHYFETAPLPNSQEKIRMWLLGDMGFGNNNQRSVRDAFYDFNQNEPIDLILTVGDNAYQDGTDEEFQDGWFENMYEDQLINTPVFLTYGNHDAKSADGEDGTGVYFDIFNLPANGECGGYPSGNESYYSHNYANIHFISVNSWDVEHTPDSPMIQWLEDDLADNEMDWTIVMIHHPFYDGQKDNLSDTRYRNTKLRENMVPLFDQYEVDLVLMGHSHTYQRSYLIDGHYEKSNTFDPNDMGIDMGDGQLDGDGAYKKVNGKGIPYVICGTAGYALDNEDLNHPIMYHNELTKGSGYLELNYDQLDFKYITSDGIISDYFTIQKDLEFTVYNCAGLNTNFGVNCDDNNPYTYQDTITTSCECEGTP